MSDCPEDRPVPPPAHASARKRAYTHHGTNDGTSTKRDNHLPLISGHLSPWADPVTDALGWQVATASRRLAVAVAALSGGKAQPHENGEWQACIPQALLTVTVTGADSWALWCRLGSRPDSGCLTVTFAPWTAATVLKCPLTALPARGTLSVRDVRITTRMGRTVRYLAPLFTTS